MMGLGRYLENVFRPKVESAFRDEVKSDSLIISNVFKIKVLSFASIVIAGASLIFLAARTAYLKTFSFNEAHLAIIAISFLGLFLYLKKSLNVSIGSYLFNAFWLVNLPLRIFMTGGLLSPLISGYLAHSVYVYCLNGQKWGRLSLFWSVVSIGFFTFIDPFYTYKGVLLTDVPEVQTLLDIITLVFVSLPIVFMFDQKSFMEAAIREMEKKSDSFAVMRRLNHEIGNSLYKALGYLQILRSKKDLSMVQYVRDPLEEIKEVGETLSRLASDGDLGPTWTNIKMK